MSVYIHHTFIIFKKCYCYKYLTVENWLEKAMSPHSSTLDWKIPWTEEPGRLQSMGLLSRAQLSDFTFAFHFHALEKEMATHSSVLGWRTPGKREPGGLPSMGLHRVGHDWSDLAAAAATAAVGAGAWSYLFFFFLIFSLLSWLFHSPPSSSSRSS